MRSTRRTAIPLATLLGVLAGGMLAMSSLAVAAPQPAPQPLEDSVTGRAFTLDAITYEFSARSGPSGENPSGQVTATGANGLIFTGSVTCLTVRGNVALIKVQLTPPAGVPLLSLRVTDLPPDFAGRPQDRLDVGFTTTAPTECSSPEPSYFSESRVFSGDIVVVDAPPLPTSKDQCKNGGWRAFGDLFRNQGQCVAFVERGPGP